MIRTDESSLSSDDNQIGFEFSESIAFEWTAKPGLIQYFFNAARRPNSRSDMLSFGFITPVKDAVLFGLSSETSNDYLNAQIVSFIVI